MIILSNQFKNLKNYKKYFFKFMTNIQFLERKIYFIVFFKFNLSRT